MKEDNLKASQPSQVKKVVIVDDEPDIVELLVINLKKNGFIAKGYNDAHNFIKSLKSEIPDLILLDLMLPDADGFEICKYLKHEEKYSKIPVIMLTARSEEMDKIIGLEIGADDYITKPFSPRELVARVKAVLRREKKHSSSSKIKINDNLFIDLQKYEVISDGQKIELTATEFKILRLLSEHKGWVYSREQILDYLGVGEKGVLDRTVDVHVKNLRDKLGEAGKLIKNLRGIGYKLEEN